MFYLYKYKHTKYTTIGKWLNKIWYLQVIGTLEIRESIVCRARTELRSSFNSHLELILVTP